VAYYQNFANAHTTATLLMKLDLEKNPENKQAINSFHAAREKRIINSAEVRITRVKDPAASVMHNNNPTKVALTLMKKKIIREHC
jgi:hypothetical protein